MTETKNLYERARIITDTARVIPHTEILECSQHRLKIAKIAGRFASLRSQLFEDEDSEAVVVAAYDNIHNLTLPSLLHYQDTEAASMLLTSDTTITTITTAASMLSSNAMYVVTEAYKEKGEHFVMTAKGLVLPHTAIENFEADRGCPASKIEPEHFGYFALNAVGLYIEAHRQNKPLKWHDLPENN